MQQEMDQYLRDADENAETSRLCLGCNVTDDARHPHHDRCIKLPRADKCEFCNIVHLLWKGEIPWRDIWLILKEMRCATCVMSCSSSCSFILSLDTKELCEVLKTNAVERETFNQLRTRAMQLLLEMDMPPGWSVGPHQFLVCSLSHMSPHGQSKITCHVQSQAMLLCCQSSRV